MHESNTFLF